MRVPGEEYCRIVSCTLN